MQNVYSLFQANAREMPDRIAVISGEKRLSYEQLGQRINRLANSLHRIGAETGSVIGFMFRNGEEFVDIFYAIQKLGAVAVPINFRLNAEEIKSYVESSACEYFLYDARYAELIACIRPRLSRVKTFIHSDKLGISGEYDLEELIEAGDPDWDYAPKICATDDALLIFTGGTTGAAKAAVHTQKGVLLRMTLREMGAGKSTRNDIFLNYAPLFHLGGLGSLMNTLSEGGCIILADGFDPNHVLRLISQEKATHVFLIPMTALLSLAKSDILAACDLSSVRYLNIGGTSTGSPQLAELAFQLFPNASLSIGYGQSEGVANTFQTLSREQFAVNRNLLNSIGKPILNCQIKLIDGEGNEVGQGEPGEAWARGPAQMKYYLNDHHPFKDGWLPTGDILRQDEQGHYYFVDRKKDVIKSGGELVYAFEVENVINSHPAIAYCAIVGTPHPYYGEIITAVVVKEKERDVTEEEIIEYCRSRMAHYKAPKRVFFENELPRTAVGKVNKVAVRAHLAALIV